jgi:hypothetical protein
MIYFSIPCLLEIRSHETCTVASATKLEIHRVAVFHTDAVCCMVNHALKQPAFNVVTISIDNFVHRPAIEWRCFKTYDPLQYSYI